MVTIVAEPIERLDAEAEKSDARMGVLNREFHLALIRPSGKFVTIQLIERLQLIAERYVRAHLEPAADPGLLDPRPDAGRQAGR